MSITLTISSEAGPKGKSRSFSASVFAYAVASALWEGGAAGDVLRPVFLLLAASDAEARSVIENLRTGRKATMRGEHLKSSGTALELPRSMGYRYEVQRTVEGTLLTAYPPALFDFQPGHLDSERVGFVLLPALEDLEAMPVTAADEAAARAHVAALGFAVEEGDSRLPRTAALWAAYLDERSELPIPPDTAFRVQLYLAALAGGLVSRSLPLAGSPAPERYEHESLGFKAYVAPGVPLSAGVATSASHADLRALLASELQRYEAARAASRAAEVRAVAEPEAPRRRRPTRSKGRQSHVAA